MEKPALEARHRDAAVRLIEKLAGEDAEGKLQDPGDLGLGGWVDWYETRGDGMLED
jgi:hypothetical protein